MENESFTFQKRKSSKNYISKNVKFCKKCGFATLCLPVLYKHKHKCKGNLLGPHFICCHCKRKFLFYNAYLNHKARCFKFVIKNKTLQSQFHKKLEKKKILKQNANASSFKRKTPSIICPNCMDIFHNRSAYDDHIKTGDCKVKEKVQKTKEKIHYSARKSFVKKRNDLFNLNKSLDYDSFTTSDDSQYFSLIRKENYLSNFTGTNESGFICLWCKNVYPAKQILAKHFEKNILCAQAHYHKFYNLTRITKCHRVARKSMHCKLPSVARKSFTCYRGSYRQARKTMSHSRQLNAFQKKSKFSDPETFFKQCPICQDIFNDSFNFLVHQKKFNHWGKAAKSINIRPKCPFCFKEFSHVAARNVHLKKHDEKAEEEIENFLLKTTCKICSQEFATESLKLQHEKITHSKEHTKYKVYNSIEDISTSNTEDSLESVKDYNTINPNIQFNVVDNISNMNEKMLKYPLICPICLRDYDTPEKRDKHVIDYHMSKIVECKFCSMKFIREENLIQHMQNFHDNYLEYECNQCKLGFPTKKYILQHAINVHESQDPKVCISLRNKNMLKIQTQDLEQHVKSSSQSTKDDYYCDMCEISFQKIHLLQRHRKSKVHRDNISRNLETLRKCMSNIPSSTKIAKRHVKEPEILKCSQCSEEFTSIRDFVPHRLSHFASLSTEISELNPYTCEICGEESDYHEHVQIHLFEHLKSQLNGYENKNSNTNSLTKKDPIVPDRLSGQHVAKKSFNQLGQSSQQEIVIGGIKKALFTCDVCNIGFTTKRHHEIHIQKYCKKEKSSKEDEKNEENLKISKDIGEKDDTNEIKSFENLDNIIWCKACNCLFSNKDLFEKHETFCAKNLSDIDLNYSKINILKSVIELECALAGCIRCGLPFDNLEILSNHMNDHLSKTSDSLLSSIQDNENEKVMLNGKMEFDKNQNKKLVEENDVSSQNDFSSLKEFLIDDTVDNNALLNEKIFEPEITEVLQETLAFTNSMTSPSPTLTDIENKQISTSNLINDDSSLETKDINDDEITSLRNNFSRLLCILISDSQLMNELGYGVQPIDEVLLNILRNMGQTPATDDGGTPPLDLLRKNIQLLLDLVLKDQVRELIADRQTTTDDVVIQALRIFEEDVVNNPVEVTAE